MKFFNRIFTKYTIALLCVCFAVSARAQWVQTSGPNAGTVRATIVFNGALYATGDNGGVFSTTDNGATWLNASIPGIASYVDAFASNGGTLYAATAAPYIGGSAYSTTDGGAHWANIGSNLGNQGWYSIAASGNAILTGGNPWWGGFLKRTTDGGTTWNTVLAHENDALLVTGGYVFAGDGDLNTGGDVWRSSDDGATWTDVDNGQFRGVNTIIGSNADLFAGTYGGSVWRSTDNGATWNNASNGLPGTLAMDLTMTGDLIFAHLVQNGGVYFSTNNGATWLNFTNGLPSTGGFAAITVNNGYVFAGVNGYIYRRPLSDTCPAPAAVVSGSATILNGQSAPLTVTLAGEAPWNITWSDGVTETGVTDNPHTRLVSPAATTTYTITALSDAHCTARSADLTGSATITVIPSATLDIYSAENLTSGKGKDQSSAKEAFALTKFGIYSQSQVSAAAKTYAATLGTGATANTAGEVLWQLVVPASGNLADAATTTFGGSPAYHYKALVPADTDLVIIGAGTDLSACALGTIINGGPASGIIANTTGTKYLEVVVNADDCKSSPSTGKGIDAGGLSPANYSLSQNYPNPFASTTTVSYSLPETEPAVLKVYNSLGAEVATLASGVQSAGAHGVSFSGANLPEGIYFYRLTAGAFSQAEKMAVMK